MPRIYAFSALVLLASSLAGLDLIAAEDRKDSVVLAGESERDSVARQIDVLDELIKQESWSKAVDQCQSLIGKNAETLVAVSADHLIQAHLLVHQRVARLPAPALKQYRSRVDGKAKKLYEEGLANHDANLLKRVVTEAFCSRYGEDSLDLLGDWAFEDSRFEEARCWWARIALPAPLMKSASRSPENANTVTLLFPNPQKNLASIRAKQLLSLLFTGNRAGFAREMQAYKELHGKSEGTLAGKKGNLAKILEDLALTNLEPPQEPILDAWSTFAGSSDRVGAHGRLPDHPNWLAHLCAEPPTCFDVVNHQVVSVQERQEPDRTRSTALQFPCHPVVVADKVLVADNTGVALYDPFHAKSVVWQAKGQANNSRVGNANHQEHSLTIYQNKAYACVGEAESSQLVCLNLDLGATPSLQEGWVAAASSGGEKEPWVFEGSPVVDKSRVFVSMSQRTPSQTKFMVACFNAETGTPLWRRDVCQAAKLDATPVLLPANLLTFAEGHVYFCSHAGLIACLESQTGNLVWAVRYGCRGRTTVASESPSHPSCPCMVSDGRLFAAPIDSDRLLCLDAFTGNSIWSRDKFDVVHLLGVGQDRLVFTTKQGIRWVDVATGLDVQSHPEGGTGPLPSQGRGLLAGNLVFWPTRQGLYVLNQKDGELPNDLNVYNLLHGRPLGNLALTSQVFAVAGPRELCVFVSPALRRKQAKEESKDQAKSTKVSEPPT